MKRSTSGTFRLLRCEILATIASLVASPMALSQGQNDWGESESGWSVFGGAFFPNIDTSIQFRSDTLGVSGSGIDIESDLGLKDSDTLPILGVRWRIAKRHALELVYFRLKRSGGQDLNVQLSFPCDAVNNCMPGVPNAPNTCGATLCILDAGVFVNTKFDTQIIREKINVR